jgi:hypothetical protein
MNCRSFAVLILFVVLLSMFAPSVLACACCAEPGTYSIQTMRPDSFQVSIIDELKFDRNATLFVTEAGFDTIKGLETIRADYDADASVTAGNFDITSLFASKTWKFDLKTKAGKTGSLVLPMPAQLLSFKADIHDSDDRGLGPSLYKEFRFKGTVRVGTGFLKTSALKQTTYFLVFQGRGNNCDSALDFTHWRLEITGPQADFAVFGKFRNTATMGGAGSDANL